MFELRELQQLMSFMQRCTLQGNESIAHANLLVKLQKLMERASAKTE